MAFPRGDRKYALITDVGHWHLRHTGGLGVFLTQVNLQLTQITIENKVTIFWQANQSTGIDDKSSVLNMRSIASTQNDESEHNNTQNKGLVCANQHYNT
jgi:hypothetical protein